MYQQRRNHAVAGIALLCAAAIVAFSASQAWARGVLALPLGPLADTPLDGALGFDMYLAPGGTGGDVRPLILFGAGVLAAAGLLLIVTRVRGLGVVWRLAALATALFLGALMLGSWGAVSDPASVFLDRESSAGQAVSSVVTLAGVAGAELQPALGLWLLTIGSAVAAIGTVIPAIRSTEGPPAGAAARAVGFQDAPFGALAPGWYPDQATGTALRWFDGHRWTEHVRARR